MNDILRTNDVFYGGCTVARYEVCIKRNHSHAAIFCLETNAFNLRNVTIGRERCSRKEKRLLNCVESNKAGLSLPANARGPLNFHVHCAFEKSLMLPRYTGYLRNRFKATRKERIINFSSSGIVNSKLDTCHTVQRGETHANKEKK